MSPIKDQAQTINRESASHAEHASDVLKSSGSIEIIKHAANGDHLGNALGAREDRAFWTNIRRYPAAVAWSVCLSTAVIMEGFDIMLVQSLLAVDAFQRQFGEVQPDGSFEVTAAWQAGFTNGALVGEMIGLILNGFLADRYGSRKTMIGALTVTAGLIFVPFFSKSQAQLLAGLILMGIPWGIFQTLTTSYAAEVVPTALRPYLTTYINICWIIGQFLANAVLVGVQGRNDQWAWRIPYALQWIWPLPIIVGVVFAPESPWWLVRTGQLAKAKSVLKRLQGIDGPEGIEVILENMIRTNEFERSVNEGTSYSDCFKGVNLRRTEITCLTWLIQTLAGNTFMGYSTYFYQQAGLSTDHAFSLSLGQYAMGAVGVFVSWFMMMPFGRRTLYTAGLTIMATLLFVIGFCGLAPVSNESSKWAIGSMLMLFTFFYDCTVGPITYALVAEMPSTRLRQKTLVLARTAYNISSIICNTLVTRQLNPTAWAWGAKTGFFWGGSCVLCLVWAFFRLPEPKNLSFAELDLLFEARTPARRFGKTPLCEGVELARGSEAE